MLSIAIPYYDAADYVEQAVRSALSQTAAVDRVIVIGDGQPVPLTLEDPRLTIYELPENRGTYFALQLALLASSGWFAVLGADDWLDPDHLERLLAIRRPAVALSALTLSVNGGPERVYRSRGSYDVGIHDAAMLRSIGGYNPAERIGQDSLTMKLIARTYGLAVSDCPTYHRRKRPGTLTTSAATGHRSLARREMRIRNRQVFEACRRLPTRRAIREYRAELVPAELREQLDAHAAELQRQLGERAA